jgi:tetratricopeptide (TPR) repeat protein
LEEARAQYAEALRWDPNYADAHFQMGVVLTAQHKTTEAMAHYRAALAAQPNRVDAMNNLAWIMAASPAPENRNGPEAVRLAARACDLTGEKSPFLLGTLAAAYAEAGRFDDAIATAQRAIDLAIASNNQALADRNRELLALYRSHEAYHDR